jgi:hypothetical protein
MMNIQRQFSTYKGKCLSDASARNAAAEWIEARGERVEFIPRRLGVEWSGRSREIHWLWWS